MDAHGSELRARRLGTFKPEDVNDEDVLRNVLAAIDLTTLEATDTVETVTALAERGISPAQGLPSVAAICVYPTLVAAVVATTAGSSVNAASVAGAFPSAQASLGVRLADIADAVANGAQEVDIVLDRSAFLSGNHADVFAALVASREACADAHLKVILETGELLGYDSIRSAARLAMFAGTDFVKTSTGKGAVGATPAAVVAMADEVLEFARNTGHQVGIKVSGGVRTVEEALVYRSIVESILGPEWLTPTLFRIGASSLLDDVLARLANSGSAA